ncbi:MAG: tetratricopeptide repeat protein, partial [Bacteroidota bacterium]
MKQIQLLLLACLLVAISSCVTQKKKGDLTAMQKLYHNTTAKYNGYFNANVLLTESIAKLEEEHQDNYNKVLPLYEFVATDDPASVSSELDEAIKKVSIVVSLHREAQWTDDCYLLIGKAQYVKQDYEAAEATLRFFAEEFSPEAIAEKEAKLKRGKKKKGRKKSSKKKKRKKKGKKKKATPKKKGGNKEEEAQPTKMAKGDNKPDGYFMKHRPAYQEGMMWLARTLIEREKYEEARSIMRRLNEDLKTFKDVRSMVAAAEAHLYLRQKEYEKSVNPLVKAVDLAEAKKDKARYSYILAQIHQQAGRSSEAIAAFDAAKKYSNEYEMEFSAELSVTKNAWVTNQISSEEVNKRLEKMLKDIKNEEYKDQIYFTLAEIAYKDGKRDLAIANYKKSAWNSVNNKNQKAEAYYQLATLFYDDEIYVDAKYYYDSTLQVMTKNDERVPEVKFRATNLTEIANNIKIIELQDSLLRVGQMSEEEKKELALNIYTEQVKAAEAAKKAAQGTGKRPAVATAPSTRFGQVGNSATATQSNFFAYNDRSLKRGKKDFDRKWGSRQLEDNWRRSNKLGNSEIEEVAIGKDGRVKDISEEEMNKILKDIPTAPEQIASANAKIESAMFKLGKLYRDRLEKNAKAVSTLEELLKRFPQTRNELDSWYYLYLSHTDLSNFP